MGFVKDGEIHLADDELHVMERMVSHIIRPLPGSEGNGRDIDEARDLHVQGGLHPPRLAPLARRSEVAST